jgi:hypothetical protein
MNRLVKISVYIPIEVKEYLNQRKISISRWCRKAIEKRMKIFVHIKNRYQTDISYRKRRNLIKRKCDLKRRLKEENEL